MTIPPDKGLEGISSGKSIEQVGKQITPGQPPAGFESHMQGTGQQKASGAGTPPAAGGPTPMDVAKGPAISTAGISYNTLLAQAQTAHDSLGTVEKQLSDQKLKMKRSKTHLVQQKLGDANSYIRSAGSKLGVELPEGKTPPGLTGISKFVSMINDGQDQLAQVQEQLKKMSANKESLSPGDMMSVQIKMGLAQQEIEYTSTLLSKVIQSVTQIINTQL